MNDFIETKDTGMHSKGREIGEVEEKSENADYK
jgi:hypothetical protein